MQLSLLGEEHMPEDPRNSWETPQDLFDDINERFGPFTVDVAASHSNHRCQNYFTDQASVNGLTSNWNTSVRGLEPCAWCNPPFGDIEPWARKAWEQCGLGVNTVMLLPANRTGSPWFHRWVVDKAREVVFLRGRVQYVPPPGVESSSCAFDSMLVVYDPCRKHRGLTRALGL